MFQKVVSKIKTVGWYIKRPHLYQQFYQLAKSKIFPEDEKRESATQWCQMRAVSMNEAFREITSREIPFDFIEHFSQEFQEAQEKRSKFPADRGGPGDINLLYHLCEHIGGKRVLETGVAFGWSSLALLLSLKNREGALLVSTDMPYAKTDSSDYVGSVVPNHLKEKWELIRHPDRQGLPKALTILPEIDMCHYDSDKSYEGRMWAYPKLWGALKPGGVFISDDIGDNFAFKDFAEQINQEPIVARSVSDQSVTKFVGILVKEG